MTSHYLNTDLEIAAETHCQSMVDLFSAKCNLAHHVQGGDGRWHSSVDACDSGIMGDATHGPVRDIDGLLCAIENSTDAIKRFLRHADVFDFNVGWQAAEKRPEGAFGLPNGLLRRIAGLGATITVTVYPSCEDDSEDERI